MSNSTSFIFIPDITGFTHFVNSTEITHAQHIISELLELIIESNQLKMTVSEVEGDAVLFYRENYIPTLKEIYEQCQKIFIEFHHHLNRYEVERVCQCGACSTASTLSIKFIAHSGDIGFTKIHNKSKPFGPTLVTAHRLLKNDIPEKEYLLLSENLWEQINIGDKTDIVNVQFEASSFEYPETGKNEYHFTGLKHFYDLVPEPTPPKPIEKVENPVTVEVTIEKPLFFVFEILTNLDLRLLWNKDTKELEYEAGKLNRSGTKHRCLFNSGFADFETIVDDFGKDTLVYGEKLNQAPGMEYVAIFYLLKQTENGTHVQMQAHPKTKPIYGFLFLPLLRKFAKKNMTKGITALKEVCEKNEEIPYISNIE